MVRTPSMSAMVRPASSIARFAASAYSCRHPYSGTLPSGVSPTPTIAAALRRELMLSISHPTHRSSEGTWQHVALNLSFDRAVLDEIEVRSHALDRVRELLHHVFYDRTARTTLIHHTHHLSDGLPHERCDAVLENAPQ